MQQPLEGRPISLGDRDFFEAAFADVGEAPSEQCFANLFLYRTRHRYRLHFAPVAHIRGVTYDGKVHALPLAEIGRTEALALLAEGVDCLFPLSPSAARRFADKTGFVLGAERADHDYLFDGPMLADLRGAKVRRGQAQRFAASSSPEWQDWEENGAEDALSVLEGWIHDVGRSPQRTDVDECREAIASAAFLRLEGGIVRDGMGKAVGFLLASRRADGERIVHFAKGRRAAEGVYPWMFAHYARATGAPRVNFEQDLGNPGLAQSKQAYRPSALRPKWRVSHRGLRACAQV